MQITKPVIMGILNVTPDSFSDGGEHFTFDKAVAHALKMANEGADIIDIGGESSRPGSDPISEDKELQRTIPVISAIRKTSNVPISIDTTKSQVALEAVKAGANMINDISAGTVDPKIFDVAAKANVPICLMHMRGTPKTMQTGDIHYDDVMGEISAYLKGRVDEAIKAGVSKNNIIIDPGIGFGKTVEQNITILKQLETLKLLKHPILIGTSRKSFIGKILGVDDPKERLEGSLATLAIAVKNGANIVRVHDVLATKRFLDIFHQLS